MNGALSAWVLEKAWKIDTKVLQKKMFNKTIVQSLEIMQIEQGPSEDISEVGQSGKTE